MSRFYFCHSPFTVLSKGVVGFIYHYDKPRFFGVLIAFEDDADFEDQDYGGYNIVFQYHRGDGVRQSYILQVMQNIDKASAKMADTLWQAAAWYCSFLDKEAHKRHGKAGSWSTLQDYNVLTKNLQILELRGIKKFLVSYPGGIKTVNSNEELDTFLSKGLGYHDLAIEQGAINYM